MTDPLQEWYRHTCSVRRYQTSGRYGGTLAPPEDVVGYLHDGSRLVAGPGGEQLTSSSTFAFSLEYPFVPLDSEVTVPAEFGGRTSKVIATARGDGGGQPTPDHYEIALL